jgi:hypothetical protein
MIPLLDPRARVDLFLLVDLLKGIRTRAINQSVASADLVAVIDDLVARIDQGPPAGFLPGETDAPARGPSL